MNEKCVCGHEERNHRWDLEYTGKCCITEPNNIDGINCSCKEFKNE